MGLADQYEAWIATQTRPLEALHYANRVETCETLLFNAGVAAKRIRQGIAALSDPKVFRAFALANAAMARQARRRRSHSKGHPA